MSKELDQSLCFCLQMRTGWRCWCVGRTQNEGASQLIILVMCAVLHEFSERETAFQLCNSAFYLVKLLGLLVPKRNRR